MGENKKDYMLITLWIAKSGNYDCGQNDSNEFIPISFLSCLIILFYKEENLVML